MRKIIVIALSFLTVLLVFVFLPQLTKKESFQEGAIYVLDSSETYPFDKIHVPKVTSSDIEQIVCSEENQTVFIELTRDYLEKNRNNTPAIGSPGGSVWLNATSEKVILIANRNGTVFLSLPQPSTSSFYPEGLVVNDVETGLLISVNNKNADLFRSLIQMIQSYD